MNEDLSFRIKFIKEIERHPCLYDHSHEDYNSKKAIDKVWTHIGEMFGEHAYDCKSKWRSIRSAYIRSVNTHSNRSTKSYYLAHHLRFLNPFLKSKSSRRESGNLSASEDEELTDSFQTVDDVLYGDGMSVQVRVSPEAAVKEEPEDGLYVDVDDSDMVISEVSNKRPSKLDRSTSPNPSAKKKKIEIDTDKRSYCEHYALSLVPYLETMTERQQLAFQRGVIDLIEKIKYGSRPE
ncbi:hypothetical protein ABMA28_002834 [Loxostege sticticalis]|uniref:MADF domain-containing protein n=1 Tax=Loxostege sticticalis TaxID=481309 RepID=A0ABD0SYG3_LOXSC